ncbi:phage tail protein, partial [Limosilactobacillus reuteri]
ELKVIAKGTAGDHFKIKNLTTGDYIERPKGFNNSTWVLDGVNATLNNEGDFLNIGGTHGGIITLNNGKNDFQIDNFSGEISFDFPFWRLS